MYLFDFKATADRIREMVAVAGPATGAVIEAQDRLETELVVQSVRFLYSHLLRYEQFTAAAHLLAWALPARAQHDPRIHELVQRALQATDNMGDYAIEQLEYRAGVHTMADSLMSITGALPGRALYWLSVARLSRAKSALEYGTGCGSNVFQCAASDPFIRWAGMDISETQVGLNNQQAQRLGRDVRFHHADARPEDTGLFECVALLDVLEHTAHPLEVIKCAERFVAPGGVIVISVPHGPWSLFTEQTAEAEMPHNHVNVSSPADLAMLAMSRGRLLDARSIPGDNGAGVNASACVTYIPGEASAAVEVGPQRAVRA